MGACPCVRRSRSRSCVHSMRTKGPDRCHNELLLCAISVTQRLHRGANVQSMNGPPTTKHMRKANFYTSSTRRVAINGSLGLLLGDAGALWLLLPPPAVVASAARAPPEGEAPPFLAASFARSALSRSRPIMGPLDASLFSSCCASPRFRACQKALLRGSPPPSPCMRNCLDRKGTHPLRARGLVCSGGMHSV